MSYAKQDKVCERLHNESLSALEALGAKGFRRMLALLGKTKRELKLAIMEAYRWGAPSGRWTIHHFRNTGAAAKLSADFHSILERFRATSQAEMKSAFNELYRQSILRHAWILDQVTPPSWTVFLPHTYVLHESALQTVYLRPQASQMWGERWAMWIEAYRDALLHNLSLGALNESSLEDAMLEVEATKANTPASTLDNAMDRLFEYEGTYAISEGAQLVATLNQDLIEEEVWKTRSDLRVCDDCDANEGLTIEESDGDIPLHPNCHCYWLLVPRSYAELLRSGDADEQDLAETLLARGLAPNSLVIRNASGDPAGKAIVDFGDWTSDMGRAVSTR